MSRISLVIFALLAAAWCAPVRADGVLLNGVSGRTIGRGGANLAHRDNGGLIFDNPAGIVNIDDQGLFEVTVTGLFTDFNYSDPDNPGASDTSFTPLPQVSVMRKSANGNWAYGIGVFTPAGFSEIYELQGPFPFGGQRRYESFGSLTKVLPTVAWKPTDRLSLGATLGVGISHLELTGPHFLQNPGLLQGLPMLIDLQGTGACLVWSAGAQYELSERTTIGATYQSASRFELDAGASITVPLLGQSRYDGKINITWPQTVGVGVRHELARRHTVSADVYWTDWSGAFDDIGVTLTDPRNPFFFPVSEEIPLDWRDSVAVRLGHEWDLEENGIVRLGYVYHRNPIPSHTLTPFIQPMMEHGISCGYGFDFRGCQIDLSYMYMFQGRQDVGQSALIGGDFDNSRHKAATHALVVGVIKRF